MYPQKISSWSGCYFVWLVLTFFKTTQRDCLWSVMWVCVVLLRIWAPRENCLLLSISWQFFKTCGVINYGSGWRKDVIDHCLEFALIPCMKFGSPYLGKAGVGIVREKTNFRCSETDFPEKKKMPAGKRNRWHKKKKKGKGNTSFGSTPNTHKTYGACLHAAVARLGRVIVNTVIRCYHSGYKKGSTSFSSALNTHKT